MHVTLLGVPIDAVTSAQAVSQLIDAVRSDTQHHILTPNSEMLVEATKNESFRRLLQSSSLNLPDSAGLLWAARWTKQQLPERVTGVDTVICFCKELTEEHPVFLLGAGPGVAQKAADALKGSNPRLVIAGTFAGSPRDEDAAMIIDHINGFRPHVLFIAYGAPQQDIWLEKHLSELPSVRVAMGVGGTFDFLAGTKKRAPRWVQKLGLEWLWRLIREPSRIGRIWNAVVVFPLLVVRYGKQGKA